ncbi:adenine deaminase [Tothia fuscella]|uniref:Adenine deaminase n=1 Tax=Tothia fuscella TaxID=1048955 RepID=A0A9P4NJK5_9PEZI|nr:adenine deaminase [Tothia fuscella]
MCKTLLHPFLESLPKCEHHLHIEGSLEPSLLFELAAKNNIVLPQDDEAFESQDALQARYKRFTSLDDFLHYYYIGMSVLITPEDFAQLAMEYFQKAAKTGVYHAEIFFDPQAHLERGVSYSTLMEGFTTARYRAQHELGMTTLLVSCFLRHLPPTNSISVFNQPDVLKSYRAGQVVGIGLDSSEKDFPPHLFKDLYAMATTLKLRRTAHAGEEGPVEYIRDALESLGIDRIDHGLHLADDEELMALVAKRGTLLTLCPLSNVVLKCVETLSDVPIRKFLDAGVKFSINSDDPAYFGGNYILDNYCAVQETFDLSIDEWKTICRSGIEGSWCTTSRKAEMIGVLDDLVYNWRRKLRVSA